MKSHADGSVSIQTSSEFVPSTPAWFGEVVLLVEYLRMHGSLTKLSEGIRFARKRFGRYEIVDFLAVLFGYAISGERTDGGSFMSDSSRLPSHSWRCLSVIGCLLAQRSRGF